MVVTPEDGTAAWSELDLRTLCHWKDGYNNTHHWKPMWNEACQGISETHWAHLASIVPNVQSCSLAWDSCGTYSSWMNSIYVPSFHEEVDDFIPSPGKWFYHKVPQSPCDKEKLRYMRDPQVAYHSTSVPCAVLILEDGLKVGVSSTGGLTGCYFEQQRRKECSFVTYATHKLTNAEDGIATACMLEAMVDRSVGRTVHSQWVQQPGSFVLTGVYTHQVSVTKLYTKGFLGWFRMHESVYSKLKSPTFRNSISAPSASV